MDKSVALVKRAVDLAGSAIGLLLGAPLAGVVAAAVKLQDGGPVLVRQRRAAAQPGPGTFELLEFRAAHGVGRVLRATGLHRLPQLVNVLRGDMSIVGPRPESPEAVEQLAATVPFFDERMRGVKPGLTGLAQVSEAAVPRAEILLDVTYAASLERLSSFARTDLEVILRALNILGKGR